MTDRAARLFVGVCLLACESPGISGDGDFTIGPSYRDAPEYAVPGDAPAGTGDSFDLLSTDSTHFTTDIDSGAPFTRPVIVWIPAQYVPGTAAPFMVLQDGWMYFDMVWPVLQTMIHQGRLPPIILIAVGEGQGGAEGERSKEYDTLSDEYVRFIEDDVLPRVEERYGVELTSDPDGRAAMGGSSGGAAAFTMGWFRPDLYRRILTYSGTFVNQEPDAMYPLSAWEYHAHLIAETDPKPLRVFLEVGSRDSNWNPEFMDGAHDWMEANRAMAAVLADRGYHYRFAWAEDAEHVDSRAIRQSLPDTLEWLWQGYPIP